METDNMHTYSIRVGYTLPYKAGTDLWSALLLAQYEADLTGYPVMLHDDNGVVGAFTPKPLVCGR